MTKLTKARIAPVAMAAVIFIGVASDFRFSASGEDGSKDTEKTGTTYVETNDNSSITGEAQNDADNTQSDINLMSVSRDDPESDTEDTPFHWGMRSTGNMDMLAEGTEITGNEDLLNIIGGNDLLHLSSTGTDSLEDDKDVIGTDERSEEDKEGEDKEGEDKEGTVDETPAPEFYTLGVEHSTVADIQQRLMDLGFMDYSEPTTKYGSITMEAVEMFQRQHDLTQDGIIGPATYALLFSDDAKYYMAKLGMSGDDIKRIQTRLYEMGYLAKNEYLTGYFGDVTEAAVTAMQQNNGLLADGKVGQMTLEMLYSENAKANLLSYGTKSEVVLACQERLKELGYLTTTPDGEYGNDTVAAVKQFQSRNDLVVDGYLGPTTMQVLNDSGAVANGLMLGDSGDTVKRVQELLAKYGYMSSANCTGYFGEVTEAAVKTFQKNNGLSADGNVGMRTMARLTDGNAVKASGSTGSSSTGSSSTGSSSGGSSSSGSSTGSNSSSGSSSGSTSTSGSVSALLAAAKSKLGLPYVYGSKGPNSFDCSGYVYWCLNQAGVKQSYITSYGWRSVSKYQRVSSFSDIKAGDIVVVYGHVGIAAGNGMVYDASSSSGKIVYRELGSWWRKNFIVAWRVF